MLIPHPTAPKLLLSSGEAGWSPPGWLSEGTPTDKLALTLIEIAQQQLGLKALLVRYLNGGENAQTGRKIRVLWVESRAPAWTKPENARWISREEFHDLELAVPELYPFLENWFQEAESGKFPARREAWARAGWFGRAESWIMQQLEQLGLKALGPVEQLKAWPISAILRVSTEQGDLYFKTSPPMFPDEARFTEKLARQYPASFPEVSATRLAEGWMLMRDFRGKRLRETAEFEHWEGAARQYARLQLSSTGYAAQMLAEGVRDRRLEKLETQIEALFADPAPMLPGQPNGLSKEEIEQLKALLPKIKSGIEELSAAGIPAALDHGDLNPGNIIVNEDGRYIFYDLSDLTITHPFFSLYPLLDDDGYDYFPQLPGWRNQLVTAYLEAWTLYQPMPRLRQIFSKAWELAALVQALNYHWIVINQEASALWEWQDTVPYYLKKFLSLAADPSENSFSSKLELHWNEF